MTEGLSDDARAKLYRAYNLVCSEAKNLAKKKGKAKKMQDACVGRVATLIRNLLKAAGLSV